MIEVINKIVTYTGVRTNVNTDNGDRTLIAYDDGELTGFKFFSPKSVITSQDKESFDFYRKNK